MEHLLNDPYHIVLEIENKRCRISRMLETSGIQQFKVTDIRGLREGSISHLVELLPDHVEKMPKDMLIKKVNKKNKFEGKTSAWIESEGCDVCNTILSHGSFLVSGRTSHDFTLVYSFIVPSFDAYRSIISALEDVGLRVKVLRLGKFESKKEILTEKQEKILWLATKTGFFDYPRKVDTVELSNRLGISPATLSETTRRGLRRLLEHYFKI